MEFIVAFILLNLIFTICIYYII